MNKVEKKIENALLNARKQSLETINKIEFSREFAAEIDGVKFINDAQSIDMDWAIETIENSDKPIIWILGETKETLDYTWLKTFLKGKVEAIVSYGDFSKEHKYKMEALVPFYSEHDNLENAFKRTWAVANPKFTIVFSPACSDETIWNTPEERGLFFNTLIETIK